MRVVILPSTVNATLWLFREDDYLRSRDQGRENRPHFVRTTIDKINLVSLVCIHAGRSRIYKLPSFLVSQRPPGIAYPQEQFMSIVDTALPADLLELSPYGETDRKSTRLNSSHVRISYAVFCL